MLDTKTIIKLNKMVDGPGLLLNPSLLDSALSSWHYYESIEDQISSIVRGIIKNHAFQDGNKRTATLVLTTLASLNNLKIIPDNELFHAILAIANSNMDVEQITHILFK